MTALTKQEGVTIDAPSAGFSLAPRNLDEAFKLADLLAKSELVPKDYRDKPGNVLVAMQWGFEVGLKPLQSLQNIAVINGRPAMWGDAVLALVRGSPLCESVIEEEDAAGTAICRVKRRGEPEQTRTFSNADAKTAGLLGKQGPWTTNPKRMKQMRARSFALRDVFTDVLRGMDVAEVVADYTESVPPTTADRLSLAGTDVPPALIEQAEIAAKGGVATYGTFWQGTGKENRRLLAALHDRLKATAEAADRARTVDVATPAVDPDTGEIKDDFVAAMNKAEVTNESR